MYVVDAVANREREVIEMMREPSHFIIVDVVWLAIHFQLGQATSDFKKNPTNSSREPLTVKTSKRQTSDAHASS